MSIPNILDFDLSELYLPFAHRRQNDLLLLSDGSFVVLSSGMDGSHGGISASIFSPDGRATLPSFFVNEDTGGSQNEPSGDILPNGNILVAWMDYSADLPSDSVGSSGVMVGEFTSDGEIVRNSLVGYGGSPEITVLENGSYFVTWWASDRWAPYSDGNETGIFGQFFTLNGDAIGNVLQVNSTEHGYQLHPETTELSDGRIVVVWASDSGSGFQVRGAILDSNGQHDVPEFIVHDGRDGVGHPTDLIATANGGFLVVWSGGAHLYDSNASLVADLSEHVAEGLNPSVAQLSTGDFVIVWSAPSPSDSDGPNYSNSDIFGLRFDQEGNPVGNIFRVNIDTYDGQSGAHVTGLQDGAFLVVWDGYEGRIVPGGEALGGPKSDHLAGTTAENYLLGWEASDTLESNSGSDFLSGGLGNDTIVLTGNGYHTAGYVAVNVSSDTQIGTQARIDLEGLVRIEAVTDGGEDTDIVQLSEQGDAFFLHDAYSGFHSSITLTDDYIGNQSTARFANIEEIRGMGGNDIIDLTSPDYSLAGMGLYIDGGAGNDVIWGSDANESISGGNGDDTIFGGVGTDVLTGGAGADVFEFTRTSANTSVTDFEISEGDTLRFYNAGGAVFDSSSVVLTDQGILITFTDTALGSSHEISIDLASSAAEFTTTLPEILGALEIL